MTAREEVSRQDSRERFAPLVDDCIFASRTPVESAHDTPRHEAAFKTLIDAVWQAAEAQRPSVAGADAAITLLRDRLAKLICEPGSPEYRDQARGALAATMDIAAPRPPTAADEREAVEVLLHAYVLARDSFLQADSLNVEQDAAMQAARAAVLAAFDASRPHPVAPAATQGES